MTQLHLLAREAGLHVDWEDAAGRPQRVSDDALAAILAALGYPAASAGEIADSRRKCAEERSAGCDFLTADVGAPVVLPTAAGGTAELIREDGHKQLINLEKHEKGARIAGVNESGTYRLVLRDREITLAIAPKRCFSIADAAPGRRLWGPSVQIPALRDDRATGFGDFATLADAARAFAARGADALAMSPVHALFPADARRFSPYAPSSRLFLNVLFGDPGLVGLPLPEEPQPELIDWEHAIPARLALLRRAFDQRGDAVRDAVARYRAERGEELERHARFDALHAHFFAHTGATGWQGWPAEYHDPAGPAVARFAAEQAEEVDFYALLQWLAEHSLAAAQKAATAGGMALGLIADLAVGMDGGGSHAWSRRDELLTGLSIGAPPDLLGPDGQNWGITGFSPQGLRRTGFASFLATLRAALGHAGGVRIDHALGLRRLWVVPEGASAGEGAYLTMPMEDMFRLLALESHRQRAIVIGEDLGTVPEGFRPAMDERGILGMRVLWFEREADGGFTPAERWSPEAAALTGTHDLATVAGWWSGRDLDWAWQLGRSRAKDEAADRSHRAEERATLWEAFEHAGAADGDPPAPDAPAPAVDAALRFVGGTPCAVALVPLEDVAGIVEQPNLPGTIDEHPNWRRRMPEATETLLERPVVASRIQGLDQARRA